MKLEVIAALDRARGIGKDGDLPWRLKGDLAYFKRTTTEAPDGKRNAVVMGRKTYESIPAKFRPLPGRLNVVLSRGQLELPEGVLHASSMQDARTQIGAQADVHRLFVIGGAAVYEAAMSDPACEQLLLTQVDAEVDCDTFFPAFNDRFERVERSEVHEQGDLCYTFDVYARRP